MSRSTDQHQHTTVASSKSGNTDSIRHMLREQKKHCSSLHANPLFQEFWHRSKLPQNSQPPVIDDLDAEGQSRLFEVIRSAAEAREAGHAGVWASFGQPYACLGQPQQLDTSAAALLPHLNRDDIEAAAAPSKQQQQTQRRGGNRVSRTGSAGPAASAIAAAAASVVAAAAAVGAAASGEAKPVHSAAPGSLVGSSTSTVSSKQPDAAKLLHHKSAMHFNTVDRLEASFPAAAVKQAERRQKAAKVQPRRFYDKSQAEADLVDAAASYGHHALPSKSLPPREGPHTHHTAAAAAAAGSGHSHGRHASATGAAAPAAGAVGRNKAGMAHPVVPVADAAAAVGEGAGRAAFFITQQAPAGSTVTAPAAPPADTTTAADDDDGTVTAAAAAAGVAAAARRMSVSMSVDPEALAAGGSQRPSTHSAAVAAAGHAVSSSAARTSTDASHHHHQGPPRFGPLTDLTMQPLDASSSSPVISWHNEFVGVRHAGYTALQQTLWQRSQDRAAARGEPATAAHFSKSLLQQLGQAGGRLQPGWIPGTTPESPFAYATALQQQQAAAGAAAAAAAAEAPMASGPRLIKPAEVELLEQFYESLCSLVEGQRLSDPLSLTLVHKVKALLEGGTFLQPAMLQGCIDCVADFSVSCGLKRFNRFLLPLLSFVRKCAGVNQAEFEAMAEAAGIGSVLYEQDDGDDAPQAAAAGVADDEANCQQPQSLLLMPAVQLQQGVEVPGVEGVGDNQEVGSGAGHAAVAQQLQDEQGPKAGSGTGGGGSSSPSSSRPGTKTGLRSPTAAAATQDAAAPGSDAAAAAAAVTRPHSPTSPGRRSTAGQGLRLSHCISAAASAQGPATARGGSSSGSRGGSCSGASTSRTRAASSATGGARTCSGPQVLSVPSINAAAAVAAAEIVQVIQAAPASQRALAAAAAGGGDAVAADGSVSVKVPGVAGPVQLISAQAAAAAAAVPAGGLDAEAAAGGADGGGEGGEAAGGAEEQLPDLGPGVDGLPYSRRMRRQEGLASWAEAAGSAAGGAGVEAVAAAE